MTQPQPQPPLVPFYVFSDLFTFCAACSTVYHGRPSFCTTCKLLGVLETHEKAIEVVTQILTVLGLGRAEQPS